MYRILGLCLVSTLCLAQGVPPDAWQGEVEGSWNVKWGGGHPRDWTIDANKSVKEGTVQDVSTWTATCTVSGSEMTVTGTYTPTGSDKTTYFKYVFNMTSAKEGTGKLYFFSTEKDRDKDSASKTFDASITKK